VRRPETGATVALAGAIALLGLIAFDVHAEGYQLGIEHTAPLLTMILGSGGYRLARKRQGNSEAVDAMAAAREFIGTGMSIRDKQAVEDELAEMARQRDMIRKSYDEQRDKLQRVTQERDEAIKQARTYSVTGSATLTNVMAYEAGVEDGAREAQGQRGEDE